MAVNASWAILTAGTGLAALLLLLGRQQAGGTVARRLRDMAKGAAKNPSNPASQWDRLVIYGAADRAEIANGLRAAGIMPTGAVSQFGLLRLLLTVLAFAASLAILKIIHRDHGLGRIYPYAAAAACFVLTKSLLRSRIAARQRRLAAELPFALDLLLLMLDSGVGLDHAFRHLAQTENSGVPALSPTFSALVDDIQCGVSYENALDKWAENVNVHGARELSSLFRQSLLYGTELGQALRSFVHEFGDRRVSMARESIGRKTAQMTAAMVLFLMPALYILLGGPAVTSVLGIFKDINQ